MSGSEKRQRDRLVGVRCTEVERAHLVARADAAGLSLGDYLRSAALDARPLRAVRRPSADHALLAQAVAQLGKIGSNVNQIAHVLNASGRERSALLDRALSELEARAVLFQALGVRPK